MEEEDLVPKTLRVKPTDLEPMSVEALQEYILELEAEIERIRAEIKARNPGGAKPIHSSKPRPITLF